MGRACFLAPPNHNGKHQRPFFFMELHSWLARREQRTRTKGQSKHRLFLLRTPLLTIRSGHLPLDPRVPDSPGPLTPQCWCSVAGLALRFSILCTSKVLNSMLPVAGLIEWDWHDTIDTYPASCTVLRKRDPAAGSPRHDRQPPRRRILKGAGHGGAGIHLPYSVQSLLSFSLRFNQPHHRCCSSQNTLQQIYSVYMMCAHSHGMFQMPLLTVWWGWSAG